MLVTAGYLKRNAATVDYPRHPPPATRHPPPATRHPRQAVRQLAGRVVAATGDELRDDATTVCPDWHGPDTSRHATAGASRTRATLT